MKKWLILVLSCQSLIIVGQNNDLSIIASSGGTFETSGLTLDWTLGELVIDYFEHPNAGLSQGFHQPVYQLVSTKQLPSASGVINILPNLFEDDFTVDMRFNENTNGAIALIRMDGTLLWEKSFEGVNYLENFSGSHLSAGAYMLIVKIQNKSLISAYPLMKI